MSNSSAIDILADVVRPASLEFPDTGKYICTGVPGTGYYVRMRSNGSEAKPLNYVHPVEEEVVPVKVGSHIYKNGGSLLAVFRNLLGLGSNDTLDAPLYGVPKVFAEAKPYLEKYREAYSLLPNGIKRDILLNFINCYQYRNYSVPFDVDLCFVDTQRDRYADMCAKFERMLKSQKQEGLYVGVFNGLVSCFDIPVFDMGDRQIYLYPGFVIVAESTIDFEVFNYSDVNIEYSLSTKECASLFFEIGERKYTFIVSPTLDVQEFEFSFLKFAYKEIDYYESCAKVLEEILDLGAQIKENPKYAYKLREHKLNSDKAFSDLSISSKIAYILAGDAIHSLMLRGCSFRLDTREGLMLNFILAKAFNKVSESLLVERKIRLLDLNSELYSIDRYIKQSYTPNSRLQFVRLLSYLWVDRSLIKKYESLITELCDKVCIEEIMLPIFKDSFKEELQDNLHDSSDFFKQYSQIVIRFRNFVTYAFNDSMLLSRISRYGSKFDSLFNLCSVNRRPHAMVAMDICSILAKLNHSFDKTTREGQIARYTIALLTTSDDGCSSFTELDMMDTDVDIVVGYFVEKFSKSGLEPGSTYFPFVLKDIGMPEVMIRKFTKLFKELFLLICKADDNFSDVESRFINELDSILQK